MENLGVITAAERQKRNKARVSVHVDGQYLGSADVIVWAESGLKCGDVLPQAIWEDIQGRQETASALDRALHRLASRARGRAEMERYLSDKGFSPVAVQYAIGKLMEYGYIDDAAFARMIVRDRAGMKPIGRRSLEYELKRLGVGAEDTFEALAQYGREDELAAAVRQADKDYKRTSADADLRKRRAKAYAGLARRGFSHEVIEEALTKVFSCSSDD